MKAFAKTVLRMFRENLGRFFTNTLIIFVSLVLIAGLGAISPVTLSSFSRELAEQRVADLLVKSTSTEGFSEDQVDRILDLGDFSYSETFFSADLDIGGVMTRLYGMDLEGREANYVSLLEGDYPKNLFEVAVGEGNTYRAEHHAGDTIVLNIYGILIKLKVTGVVSNPLYFTNDGEPALTDTSRNVEQIIYLSPKLLSILPLPYTDLMLRFTQAPDYFTDEYEALARETADTITETLGSDNVAVLTLEENFSYRTLEEAMNKVEILAIFFPIVFVVICALVNFIVMKKLIEDERSKIACCDSLGIPEHRIALKYIAFSLLSSIVGFALGMLVGPFLIPIVAYNAIGILFTLPPVDFSFAANFGIYFGLGIIVISLIETLIMVHREMSQTPASLLTGKAPKAGKKILLEHVKPLWKILPFRYKSSLRNIFRNKVNLILTTLSIAGSEGLVYIGFGLLAISLALRNDALYSTLSGPMVPISLVIVACALALAVLIVFNLAEMNIAERQREIATLKVLGYTDRECDMYVFREIVVMTGFGICIGLPMGVLFMWAVIRELDFGALNEIAWYWYLICIGIIGLATAVVDWLLRSKIQAVDMNDSLKSID